MRAETELGIWVAPSAGQGASHFLGKSLALKVEPLRPDCLLAWGPLLVTTCFFFFFSGLLFNTPVFLSQAPCPNPGFGPTSPQLWHLSSFLRFSPYFKAQSCSRKAANFFFLFDCSPWSVLPSAPDTSPFAE